MHAFGCTAFVAGCDHDQHFWILIDEFVQLTRTLVVTATKRRAPTQVDDFRTFIDCLFQHFADIGRRQKDVVAYLRQRGWTEVPPDRPACLVFQEPPGQDSDDDPFYQFVPDSEKIGNYARMMFELLTGVAEFSDPDPSAWFNTAAFSRSTGVYGTAPRNARVGPGLHTFDLSFSKTFPLPFEKHELLFRSEFFNAFNTPQYANPGAVLGTGTFGRVTGTRADNRRIQFALKYTF